LLRAEVVISLSRETAVHKRDVDVWVASWSSADSDMIAEWSVLVALSHVVSDHEPVVVPLLLSIVAQHLDRVVHVQLVVSVEAFQSVIRVVSVGVAYDTDKHGALGAATTLLETLFTDVDDLGRVGIVSPGDDLLRVSVWIGPVRVLVTTGQVSNVGNDVHDQV